MAVLFVVVLVIACNLVSQRISLFKMAAWPEKPLKNAAKIKTREVFCYVKHDKLPLFHFVPDCKKTNNAANRW